MLALSSTMPIELSVPGQGTFRATAINDAGQVTGFYNINGVANSSQAFVFDGQMRTLDGLQTAFDINNLGEVLGDNVIASLDRGIIQRLSGANLSAFGLNDFDEIVGINTFPDGARDAFSYNASGVQ